MRRIRNCIARLAVLLPATGLSAQVKPAGTGITLLNEHTPTGIFSLAFIGRDTGICVGGDYAADTVRLRNAALTRDGGRSWRQPVVHPFGYRSCVVYYSPDTLLATGTSGTDLSTNGGLTWQKISSQGFNVIGVSPGAGKAVFLAGSDGRIARLGFSTRYAGKQAAALKAGE